MLSRRNDDLPKEVVGPLIGTLTPSIVACQAGKYVSVITRHHAALARTRTVTLLAEDRTISTLSSLPTGGPSSTVPTDLPIDR